MDDIHSVVDVERTDCHLQGLVRVDKGVDNNTLVDVEGNAVVRIESDIQGKAMVLDKDFDWRLGVDRIWWGIEVRSKVGNMDCKDIEMVLPDLHLSSRWNSHIHLVQLRNAYLLASR